VFFLPVVSFGILAAYDRWDFVVISAVSGLFITALFAFAIRYVHKYLFWYLTVTLVPATYVLMFGSYFCFVGFLQQIFHKIVPLWLIFIASGAIYLIYFTLCFTEFYRDYLKNEKDPLKGIDTVKGEINVGTMRISNANGIDIIMGKFKIWQPLTLFMFIMYPFGFCIAGLFLQANWRIITMAFGMFYLILIWTLLSTNCLFMLYVVTRLQIKHRKWFRITGIEEAN
jgi:hypothetical protein